jgi:hypothetical protein
MKEIQLTKGYVALVDDEDYERVSQYSWRASPKKDETDLQGNQQVYASGRVQGKNTGMHRFILGLQYGDKRVVDHLNHKGLDNRKENLRVVTNRDNSRRQKPRIDNRSGYKGVDKRYNKWRAQISIGPNNRTHLGCFNTKEDAARAYNEAAIRYFGDSALLNIIPNTEERHHEEAEAGKYPSQGSSYTAYVRAV